MKLVPKSGTDSPFTTRRLTEAGSIRPKSKSASSPGNALVPGEFLIWRPCVRKPAPGIAASTMPAPKSTGSSTAKPPDASSATKGNHLSGQRPRRQLQFHDLLSVFEVENSECTIAAEHHNAALVATRVTHSI